MNMENVQSVLMDGWSKEETVYTKRRRPRLSRANELTWKRRITRKKKPPSVRSDKNNWHSSLNYFIYIIMCGNGPEAFPLIFNLSLELSGITTIFLLLLYTIVLVMPIVYIEIFLGKYTRLTNGQIYRMAPIFFGYSVMLFVMNLMWGPLCVIGGGSFLIAAIKVAIDSTYGDHCPKGAKQCYEDARKLANYSRLVCEILRGTFTIHTIFHSMILLIALDTEGSLSGLSHMMIFKINQPHFTKIVVSGFFVSWKMGLIDVGYMTSSACSSYKSIDPGAQSLFMCMGNVMLTIFYLVIAYAVAGALSFHLGIPISCCCSPNTGFYFSMVPSLFKLRKTPQNIVVLYHLTNWFLEISRMAIRVTLLIENIYDYLPKFSNYEIYVKMLVGFICAVVGLVFSFQLFVVVLIPAYVVLYSYFVQGYCLLTMCLMIFYVYGVNRLSDDIHFASGKKPMKYWIILWRIYPMIVGLYIILAIVGEVTQNDRNGMFAYLPDHPIIKHIKLVGVLISGSFAGVLVFTTFAYIVMGLKASTKIKSMFRPQFYWGPPEKELRMARKLFAPRSYIRSQPIKKKKQRFRMKSIKELHEKDIAEQKMKGRIFVDAMFFGNVGTTGFKFK